MTNGPGGRSNTKQARTETLRSRRVEVSIMLLRLLYIEQPAMHVSVSTVTSIWRRLSITSHKTLCVVWYSEMLHSAILRLHHETHALMLTVPFNALDATNGTFAHSLKGLPSRCRYPGSATISQAQGAARYSSSSIHQPSRGAQ